MSELLLPREPEDSGQGLTMAEEQGRGEHWEKAVLGPLS